MLRREDPRITAGHFYQRQITETKQEDTMSIEVKKNEGTTRFDESHPVEIIISERRRWALPYKEAYELARDILAELYSAGQVENYRITTKAPSELNTILTKDW